MAGMTRARLVDLLVFVDERADHCMQRRFYRVAAVWLFEAARLRRLLANTPE